MLQVFGSWSLVQTAVALLEGIYCSVTPRKYVLHMCIYIIIMNVMNYEITGTRVAC